MLIFFFYIGLGHKTMEFHQGQKYCTSTVIVTQVQTYIGTVSFSGSLYTQECQTQVSGSDAYIGTVSLHAMHRVTLCTVTLYTGVSERWNSLTAMYMVTLSHRISSARTQVSGSDAYTGTVSLPFSGSLYTQECQMQVSGSDAYIGTVSLPSTRHSSFRTQLEGQPIQMQE